jgi:hypothetical protein
MEGERKAESRRKSGQLQVMALETSSLKMEKAFSLVIIW